MIIHDNSREFMTILWACVSFKVLGDAHATIYDWILSFSLSCALNLCPCGREAHTHWSTGSQVSTWSWAISTSIHVLSNDMCESRPCKIVELNPINLNLPGSTSCPPLALHPEHPVEWDPGRLPKKTTAAWYSSTPITTSLLSGGHLKGLTKSHFCHKQTPPLGR